MKSNVSFGRSSWLYPSALVVAALLGPGCGSNAPPPPPVVDVGPARARLTAAGVQPPTVRFADITASAGIRFFHTNGAFGKKLLPETMGSGAAFFDFDNDGHPDLLLINSCPWPGHEETSKPPPTLALYRNKGDGTFEDVTSACGLAITMYGMGVTVGDYDNDGWPDLFITGVGGNRLFRNVPGEGGRRFVDVTREAGVGGPGGWPVNGNDFLSSKAPITFSSSAAFLDYDGDGLLDLFVCNYVIWSPHFDLSQNFQLTGGGRAYGPPTNFEGTQAFLYRNKGDGTFEDVSVKAGIHVVDGLKRAEAKSLGVAVFDADEDGWPDIVVANDTVRNFYFHNRGDGTFEEMGRIAGIAYAEGKARGAMGIDWGEYRPGRCALLVGNFADEPNTFLRLDNPKQTFFSDAAIAEGIAGPSKTLLKFGTLFLDYDLDGRQDLLTCNGHLEPEIHQVQASQHYKQPVQVFWNTAARPCFIPVGEKECGPDLFKPMVGRGCAYADIDGDGDLDVILTENGGPARLLRNDQATGHNWIRLQLEGDGQRSNRSAIGARVVLKIGDVEMRREVASARGYLSQSELVLTFGLGKADKVDKVTIYWPGRQGGKQEVAGLAVNKLHRIRQDVPK